MARVNACNPAPVRLRLVAQERPQLVERPGMQAAARLPAALLYAAADVPKVLNGDHCAGLDGIDDAPTEHVVAIAAEAVNLPGQLAEMFLSRKGAFRLKRTLQSEVPAVYFPPVFLAPKAVVGADGGPAEAHIHTDDNAGRLELHIGEGHHGVKPETAFAADQVGTVKANGLFQKTLGVWVSPEWHLEPSNQRGQADDALFALECIRPGIVANREESGGRAGYLAALPLQGKGASHRFRRPHAGRDHELSWKLGESLPEAVVGSMVQPDSVLLRMFPAMGGYGVEARGMLPHRLQEGVGLVGRRVEPESDCSLHTHILSHYAKG
ncbi:MAG: hypothetical protein Q8P31_02405, partial [Bacillota bacterium]|nr:hypothetical protein [Bacillota bacterium]